MSSAIIRQLLVTILLSLGKVFSTTIITTDAVSSGTLQLSNFSNVTVVASIVPNDGTTPNESQVPLSICPNTSCNGRCGQEPQPYRNTPCACDIHCTTFRDCCVDFHSLCGNITLDTNSKPQLKECDGSVAACVACVDYERFRFRPMYMVSRCPNNFRNRFVVDRCHGTGPLVLLYLPAYQNVSGYMYRNVYCAICHGVEATKIKTFQNEITCPCQETVSKSYLEELPLFQLNFTEIDEYHCKVDINIPDVDHFPERECILVEFGSCAEPGLLQDYCDQYLEPVRVVLNPGEIEEQTATARNQYCAKCSPYAENERNCWTKRFKGGGIFTDGLKFSVLFDFSSDIQIPVETLESPTVKTPLPSTYDQVSFQNYIFDFVIEFPSTITPREIRQTVAHGLDTESVSIAECSEVERILHNATRIYSVNGTKSTTGILVEHLIENVDSFVHGTNNAYTVLVGFFRNTLLSLDTVCIAPMSYYNNDTFFKLIDSVQIGGFNSTDNNVTIGVNFPLEIFWGQQGNQTIKYPCLSINNDTSVQVELFPLFGVCGDVIESHCDLTTYDIHDLLNTTESKNLSQLDMAFQYQVDSMVAVCKYAAFREDGAPSNEQRSEAEFYVTVIGSTLSILGLIFTIGTYCAFTELRNLAGKCILNLVGSMLGAQSLFIVGGVAAWRNEVTCQTVAVLQHLLWLATFSWTNILAYDLARTFSGKASVPRTHAGNKRFMVYCCVAWGIPVIVVSMSVGLHYSEVVNVGYGRYGVCWIRDRFALLGAFIAPVSAHLLFNIAAFSYTVYHIKKIIKLAADMNVTSDKRNQLSIYVRITAIMGFTWIIGYLSNIQPVEALWVIFAAFNSLQGFFIFIAFVLTSKVLRLYKKRFAGKRYSSGTMRLSSTATSSSNLVSATSTAL